MQYHYMSDKELYHYGRSKKDGAPIGSGRYPLGSGSSRYANKMASKIESDYKNKTHYNPTGKSINQKESARLTINAERNKIQKSIANGIGRTVGIGIGAMLGGITSLAIFSNPIPYALGVGATLVSAGAAVVNNVRAAHKHSDLNQLAAAYNIPESDVISKRGINMNSK